MTRSRAATAAAVALLAVLPTAGCYQAYEKTVSVQGPSGDGVDLEVGTLLVQDTTLVAGEDGKRASLVLTLINTGQRVDALTSATVAGSAATIRTAPIAVTPGNSVQVGGPSEHQILVSGLTVPTGAYADLRLAFRDAGSVTAQVLVVPAAGYYASFGPDAARSATR